jgi:predicted dehydrogenase
MSVQEKRVRVLLVGCGAMGGQHHLPWLLESPDVGLVGVVTTHPVAVQGYRTPVYVSLERALEELRPELSIIATPHNLHFAQAMRCLQSGSHVLVEKPLALQFNEAEAVVEFAEKNHRLLLVDLQRRYEAFAAIFNECRSSGLLGKIEFVHGLFAHRFSSHDLDGWRSDPNQAGAGILDDSGMHLLDLLLYCSGGKAQGLHARVLRSGKLAMPHSFTCFFETDVGATVSASCSYLSPADSVQEEISVWGSEGALFARRFREDWNTEPPSVVFKSVDGSVKNHFDVSQMPFGKELPLRSLVNVLVGKTTGDTLLASGRSTLETHRLVSLIKENS